MASAEQLKALLKSHIDRDDRQFYSVALQVAAHTYWQTNSPKAGYATLVFFTGDSEAILGLPLMNNYFTVFDRSVDKGHGVVSFAKIK